MYVCLFLHTKDPVGVLSGCQIRRKKCVRHFLNIVKVMNQSYQIDSLCCSAPWPCSAEVPAMVSSALEAKARRGAAPTGPSGVNGPIDREGKTWVQKPRKEIQQ